MAHPVPARLIGPYTAGAGRKFGLTVGGAFVVLALISGMFGWTAVAANMNGFAVQLFSLLLALFILAVSLSLIGANIED